MGRNPRRQLYGPFASIRGRFGSIAIRPGTRIRRVPVEMVSAQNQSLHRPVGSFDGQPASGADRLAMAGGKPGIALGPGPPFSTRRPGDARAGPNAAASGRFVGLVGGPGALPHRLERAPGRNHADQPAGGQTGPPLDHRFRRGDAPEPGRAHCDRRAGRHPPLHEPGTGRGSTRPTAKRPPSFVSISTFTKSSRCSPPPRSAG